MGKKNVYLATKEVPIIGNRQLLCGEYMISQGSVNKDFMEACIEREKEYPTGLPADIPVAIPHSKAAGIKENCVCFLRLDKPVRFYRMDDSEEYVDTQLVFNLAIKEADDHLEFLQKLMQFVLDVDTLNKCSEIPLDEIPAFLEEELG